jgi:predicted dehydrogenase
MAEQSKRIRYAVVGAGNLAQVAVLPAFHNARENSELAAIITGEREKREGLEKLYRPSLTGTYDELERVIEEGKIEAIYLATPNTEHRSFTERAARCGVHVLCEKPMAVTVEDCEAMIRATQQHGVKLMIAYRLHFEETNLRAVEIVRSGELGDAKIFSSVFAQHVRRGDIRTQGQLGGGAIFDMGVYPINAARYLFRDEPIEVFAISPPSTKPEFAEVDETTTIFLRFPRGQVAQMTVSLGAAAIDNYRVVGTEGELRVEPAFGYTSELKHYLTKRNRTTETTYAERDQFAPELIYFSRCILENKDPEPSGEEGLADVRIVCAALESIKTGHSVSLPVLARAQRPDLNQEIHKPKIRPPKPIDAPAPVQEHR